MATKPELEAEVEQLKAQLAANTPPDVVAMTAELDKLKADLDQVSDEKDQLAEQASEASGALADAMAKLQAKDADLQAAQDAAAKAQAAADAKVADLQKQLDDLAAKKAEGCDGNHVSLDGGKYDIIWRSTVKDIVYEGYHKRNLDDNHTAIVISKIGG